MNRLLSHLIVAFVLFLGYATRPVHAQIAIYGGFSGARASGVSSEWIYGPMVGLYKQHGYVANTVNIGGDLRGSFLGRNGFHYYTVAVGPRVAFKPPVLPLRP